MSRRRQPSIPCVRLTRKVTPFPTTNVTFTVVDLETTGLNPDIDRIVEVGLVKFSADGRTIDEFATLVNNPGSSPEAVAIHRIRGSDLVGAPRIEAVLPEVFAFIAGTVLVGHNFSFEDAFLSTAALRAAIPVPRVIGVCTLDTCRNHLDGRAFSLPAMYKTATGEWAHDRHTALGDARAVKEVLLWLLRKAPSAMYFTQDPRGDPPSVVSETCQIRCRPVPLVRASMDDLLASFPQSPRPRKGNPQAVHDYKRLLNTSVDDSRLTMQEASDLTRLAMATGLTGSQLRQLHRQAWDTAFTNQKDVPWSSLTPVRRREMFLLADALGLADLAKKLNAVIAECSEPEPPPEARYLRGLRIAIVGEETEIVALRERAESYGAKLAVNVTKTVQWLATTTPDAIDSRHTSARKLGIPILTPALAHARLNEAIQEAGLKAYERQREADEFAALRRQREIEADSYWRPVWRKSELAGMAG
jgi:DNA polymerase III epsilon subunit-like protein